MSLPSVTPFFLYWLWVAAVSVVMLRLPDRDLPAAADAEAGPEAEVRTGSLPVGGNDWAQQIPAHPLTCPDPPLVILALVRTLAGSG